ncbi:retron St85 family effector protein [Hydrogenophaga sp. SNF1]|uniref:retron St85 family effector protein n=1 Tax=Hydrogenophaga sp. SNF1 TaxID=3098762 RepID=UPI002ACBDD35|nr:retron St85 family effector protein [Hydrogenophaga sp. SNF1]WQB82134.1 retron St85 family effector protein [Hydrogenophaga sp. SNF1]
MLSKIVASHKSAIGAQVKKFGRLTLRRPPLFLPHSQLIFLCGANANTGIPSARRKEIKRFIESLSPQFRVIYAENVFTELKNLGGNKNSLDLEDEISRIADKVLIILESPSAFCELGAFSHATLRKNVIVINDSHFRSQESFINTGPIAALEEVKSPVLWYPMANGGIQQLDGIGAVFGDLGDALNAASGARARRIRGDASDLKADRTSLYFIHDVIHFSEPITYEEIIDILKSGFGEKDYGILKRLLGILKASGFINSTGERRNRIFRSAIGTPLMRHELDTKPLIAAFRGFHLRHNPGRFG